MEQRLVHANLAIALLALTGISPAVAGSNLATTNECAIETRDAAPLVGTVVEKHSRRSEISVADLKERLSKAQNKPPHELAKQIDGLQLNERLSSAELIRLTSGVRDRELKDALLIVGDTSTFLDPPSEEIPDKGTPDEVAQKQILLRLAEYLRSHLPRLPNFYATRLIKSFRSNEKGGATTSMRSIGVTRTTVYYRNGEEVTQGPTASYFPLVTEGIFGPVLSAVVADAARSGTLIWRRWEMGTAGTTAVFQFRVAQAASHYLVSGARELGLIGPTAYHGEIAVDPESGAVLRLLLRADPDLSSRMQKADVVVEYGTVAIGGRNYICPLHSVSRYVGIMQTPANTTTRDAAQTQQLNDVTFDHYHVFRSEMRIVH